jgi:hypothetical protein
VQQQPAVLPDPVVTAELLAVALVHVDVVDPVAGQEPEDLVPGGRLGPPPLAERIDPGRRVGRGPFHEVVQLVGQVVVGPGGGGRHRTHHCPVEQVGPEEVKGQAAGRAREQTEPVRQTGQALHHRVGERLLGQVQQLRGVLLGQHVDRHPKVDVPAPHMDLVVRGVGSALGPPVDHPSGQHPISRQRHRVHPFLMVGADLSGPVSPRSTHRIGRRGQQRHAVRVDPQRLDCLPRQTLT